MQVKIKTELVNKNIKFLQELIGYTDDDAAAVLGIGKRQYQRFKSAQSDSIGFREVIQFYADLFSITEDELLTTDLTKGFEGIKTKKMFDKLTITDLSESEDLLRNELNKFPVFNITKKSQNFDNAHLCLNHFIETGKQVVDFLTLAKGFEYIYDDEKIPEALANELICFILYFNTESSPKDVRANITVSDFIEKYMASFNEKLLSLNKMYSDHIDEIMSKLAKYKEFNEFIQYYTALRYLYGIYDPDKIDMDIQEMQRFGRSLLINLQKTGNKYCK